MTYSVVFTNVLKVWQSCRYKRPGSAADILGRPVAFPSSRSLRRRPCGSRSQLHSAPRRVGWMWMTAFQQLQKERCGFNPWKVPTFFFSSFLQSQPKETSVGQNRSNSYFGTMLISILLGGIRESTDVRSLHAKTLLSSNREER